MIARIPGSGPKSPPPIVAPSGLETASFRLRPLTPQDNELDHAAVMASQEDLLLRSGGDWPHRGFTLEENLEDLVRHHREHQQGVAFTYTIMNLTETECLGCVYIHPGERFQTGAQLVAGEVGGDGSEAITTFWVTPGSVAFDIDLQVLEALRAWFRDAWPFRRVYFVTTGKEESQIALFESLGLERRFELHREPPGIQQLGFA